VLARRGFLLGLGSLIAAPAIVRAGSLMPVKASLCESDDDHHFLKGMSQRIHATMFYKSDEEPLFRTTIPFDQRRTLNLSQELPA
jgi:hypothetical protein